MVNAGHMVSLALLMSFAFGVADAIRNLKDGPRIDAEGREYKSAPLRTEAADMKTTEPQINDDSSVRIRCTEATMVILVKADLFKNGHLLAPEELFLGETQHSHRSQCWAVAAGDTEYVIEAGLQDCGSKLSLSEDSVIYSNKLIVSPTPRFHGIARTAHAVVPVSCHYKRTHLVSSNIQQQQQQLPHSAPSKLSTAEFSLKLMDGDWTSEAVSSVFYIGDLLHLEASYTGPDSGRRQLFIDGCVATLSPDSASFPRYYFIQNHGCLADAKEEGSNSLFRPRTRASSLQLQLDAFLFYQDTRNSIFITCQLKATSEMWKSSPINKACNYVHSRWFNVDGGDVCRCCDATCYNGSPNERLIPKDTACATITLGPVMVLPGK